MAERAKHAYGSRKNLEAAIASRVVDAYDVLFLNGEGEKPAMGWVDKYGNPIIIETGDTTALESQVESLESEIATKVNAEEVDAKINKATANATTSANAYTDKMVEAAMEEHLTKKYEITDVPEGTLVDYRESEIRVMCPTDAVWTKQNVGAGGDANSYYMTFRVYAPNDNVVGYIEHMGSQSDEEILTSFNVDEYGRRYQPTWLALAKYDEASGTWTYYGASSSESKYIGWDYQIDWYNADNVMIASDCVRINLSNEGCHFSTKPYYVGSMMTEVEMKIAEATKGAIEVIEF